MKRKRMSVWAIALVLTAAVSAPQVRAAESALDYAPKDCDVVIGLNIQSLIKSKLFNAIIDQRVGRAEFDAQMQLIKNMSGLSYATDLQQVYVFGKVGDNVMTILVEGKFNQGLLIDLVRPKQGYRAFDLNGRTVHSWKEGGSTNHACFVGDNRLLLCNDLQRLLACLDTSDEANAKRALIRQRFQGFDEGTVVGVFGPVTNPNSAAGSVLTQHGVRGALARLSFLDDRVEATAALELGDAQNANNIYAIALGGLAFLRIASQEDPEAQRLLNGIDVALGGENNLTVLITARVSNDQVLKIITEGPPRLGHAARGMARPARGLIQAANGHKPDMTPATVAVPEPTPEPKPETAVKPAAQKADEVAQELADIMQQMQELQKRLEELRSKTVEKE